MAAYQALTELEPAFRVLLDRYGEVDPFVWHDGGRTGTSNFAAMALHITGQQISTRVAFTVFDRISTLVGGTPTPQRIAAVEFDRLRATGLSNAKTRYIQSLARAQLDGAIDLENMDDLDDAAAVEQLIAQPGIGRWSAEMFLIHQLHRADVLPAGDVGIRWGIQQLWQLDQPPTIPDTVDRGRAWSPYRSYAAALLWRSLAPTDQLADPKERELARQEADN
ncbi:DNA-3-methyladenine glycosylase family protein [Kribbella jiaozuonensis]|uniref:DNA-3-methyladenine glycosylase II n=1 Tax=Kribbella jiaozuonensis TaxID=2575441 RepID=A0A4U3LJC1_9ACTN|nr:DNA-3-methyladenine glycosylase [Kribbella jiaozuonensis]TKK75512.1 DNA-3-methyladenine glycosylase 2 family protein [Kribbella jiaozuonensis]